MAILMFKIAIVDATIPLDARYHVMSINAPPLFNMRPQSKAVKKDEVRPK
jgi:hypothetical protein